MRPGNEIIRAVGPRRIFYDEIAGDIDADPIMVLRHLIILDVIFRSGDLDS